MMKKWEYKIEMLTFNLSVLHDDLNAFGLKGWELVCILDDGGKGPSVGFFKRSLDSGESNE